MSEVLRQRKAKEGDALMEQGKASLQTSWFKWKPNWAEACRCYKDAATCFKVAKLPDREIEAREECAKANLQLELAFSAAMCYQEAAEVALNLGDHLHAKELFEQAATHFGDQEMEKRALMTSAAARAMIGHDNEYARVALASALDIFEAFDREYRAAETYSALVTLLLDLEDYDEAVSAMKRHMVAFEKMQQPHNIYRTLASIIILHLARNNEDVAGAEELFAEQTAEHEGYRRSDDGRFVDRLLDLVAHGPEEDLGPHVRKYQMMFSIPKIVHMLRGLKCLNREIQHASLDEFLNRPAGASETAAVPSGSGAAASATSSSGAGAFVPPAAAPFGDGAAAAPTEDPTAEEDDDDDLT